MKIKRFLITQMSLEEFAKENDLTLELHERNFPSESNMRYYVSFSHVEVKDGGCLVGSHGNGSTENNAIDDYIQQITMKTIVISAMNPQKRREIQVPRLLPYTKECFHDLD